jgi:Ca2+-binding RTX toxin-like protein
MAHSIYLEDIKLQSVLTTSDAALTSNQLLTLPNGYSLVFEVIKKSYLGSVTITFFDADGNSVGEPHVFSTETGPYSDLIDYDVMIDSDGHALLAYSFRNRDPNNLVTVLNAVRFTETGDIESQQELLTLTGYKPQIRTVAASDGGLVVMYSDVDKPVIVQDGQSIKSNEDTILQSYSEDGTALGDPIRWVNEGQYYYSNNSWRHLTPPYYKAIDELTFVNGADGSMLAIIDDHFNGSYGALSALTGRVIQPDGTISDPATYFQSSYDEYPPYGVIRIGEIEFWSITADPAGGFVLLYNQRALSDPDDPDSDNIVEFRIQRISADGSPIGTSTIAAVATNYVRSMAAFLEDVRIFDDGSIAFITRAGGQLALHTIAAGETTATSSPLIQPDAGDEEFDWSRAMIRDDGGVILMWGIQDVIEGNDTTPSEDGLILATYDATGQLESPTIYLDDKRYFRESRISLNDNLTFSISARHRGDIGDEFYLVYWSTATFSLLTPTDLTDDAEVVTLTEAGFLNALGGDDSLTGSAEADRFLGGDGDDLLDGQAGDDMFRPDAGDDTVLGGDGEDTVFYNGASTDYFIETLEDTDVPDALTGQGPVYALTGRDDREGDGRDLLTGVEYLAFNAAVLTIDEMLRQTLRETGGYDDLIEGTKDSDTLEGGIGEDTLQGLGGADLLLGGEDNDTLQGGDGDDTLTGGHGIDVLEGGDGDDLVTYSGDYFDYEFYLTQVPRFEYDVPDLPEGVTRTDQAVVIVARDDATGEDQTDFLYDIEYLQFADRSGTLYDLLLSAGVYNQSISGTDQDDTLIGGIGHDAISARAGNDLVYGGPGNDKVEADYGNNQIYGNLGDDELRGGLGDDTLDGGPGNDSLSSGNGSNLLRGGDGDDFLQGWSGANTFEGGAGDDRVDGGTAADLAYGEDGNDTLDGNDGDDVVDGGDGDDFVRGNNGDDFVFGRSGNDTMNGGRGSDTMNGGDGDDLIIGGFEADDLADLILGGAGDDTVLASSGNDSVFGGDGDDKLDGDLGADTLSGQNGNDTLTGGGYSDLLFGNAGDDFINGGFGFDRINGGIGADKFFHLGVQHHGSDWVQDYNAADGDVLMYGNGTATSDQFLVTYNHTANGAGVRAGDADVQEAFVIYRPTGQILWALVDGAGQSAINLQIAGQVYDLT